MSPDFYFENQYWQQGFLVLGLDEVGRGAWAGPVVAAAVAFPPSAESLLRQSGINDSKLLTSKRREELAKLIKQVALCWGIGQATNGEIDRRGIVWATQKAMRQAVRRATKTLADRPRFLLIDAFHIRYLAQIGLKQQRSLVKGDRRSLSIAAASILAKVYRDQLMIHLGQRYPFYRRFDWEKNKGYGTLTHREAIKRWGITRYHRRSYLKWLDC